MRKILFIFLLVPFISLGQDKEIIELRNELNTVKENLNSHHKEFITGVVVSIVGYYWQYYCCTRTCNYR